jgi:hypothetical protein
MGEDFLHALPLERVDAKEFCGVIVYRMWGTKVGIMQSTDMLTERYPSCQVATLSDALWIGKIKLVDDRPWADLYELIVMRRVTA